MTPFRRGATGDAPITASEVVHDAVGQMVQQFADPYAFLRELVQNSIDAGSTCITVSLDASGAQGADGVVRLSVRDDGSGMDQDMITRCLLVLFRSSKDNDPSKIGKFGVGFFSVFASRPRVVTVETGRDPKAPGLKLSLRPDYTYDLEEHSPRRGTVVTLDLPRRPSELAELARRAREALTRWCPHVAVELWLEVHGVDGFAPSTRIDGPLRLDAPFQIRAEERDGTVHLLGLSRAPTVSLYNRGILLHTETDPVVPGVSWVVDAPRLRHTVSRDGVRKDDAYLAVLQRAQQLALGTLKDRLPGAFAEMAARCVTARRTAATDLEAAEVLALLADAAHEGPFVLKPEAIVWPLTDPVPALGGDGRTARFEAGWFRAPVRYAADGPDALTAALAAQGTAVVDLGAAGPAGVASLTRLFDRAYGEKAARASDRFSLVRFAGVERESDAERALLRALQPLFVAVGLRAAVFCEVIGLARDHLALPVDPSHPGVRGVQTDLLVAATGMAQTAGAVALVRTHPKVQAALAAARRDPDLAALILVRFVLLAWGALDDDRDASLQRNAILGAEAAR